MCQVDRYIHKYIHKYGRDGPRVCRLRRRQVRSLPARAPLHQSQRPRALTPLRSPRRLYALLFGAWSTFKLLKGGQTGQYDAVAGERMLRFWAVLSGLLTYDTYFEWILSFWVPFYYEMKLTALLWLAYPGSDAPRWLFNRLLHPAMAVAAFHVQRDVVPRIAAAALSVARALQVKTLQPLTEAVRRDELKMWDRSVRGQLAAVQMELERRRGQDEHVAGTRLRDPAAAQLLADEDASRAQLLRELLEPAVAASASGGLCGSYKRGQAAVVSKAALRRASSVGRVRFVGDPEEEVVRAQEAPPRAPQQPRSALRVSSAGPSSRSGTPVEEEEEAEQEEDEDGEGVPDFLRVPTPGKPLNRHSRVVAHDKPAAAVLEADVPGPASSRPSNVNMRRRKTTGPGSGIAMADLRASAMEAEEGEEVSI